MTKNEIRQLLTVLKVAYPLTYRNMSNEEMRSTAELYYKRFQMYPVEAVALALDQYIDENEKPPSVAGIKKYLQRLDPDYDYEEMFKELWKAIEGNRKFEDLCEVNKKFAGSPQQIENWGKSEDTIQEVIRGQFMKRAPEIVERMKFEDKAIKALGETGVRTLKEILQGHRKTDELPEAKIGELVEDTEEEE